MKIAIIADPLDNQSAGVHVFTRELIAALIRIGKADQLVLIREALDPELNVKQIVVPNIRLPIGFASMRLFFIVPFLLQRSGVAAVFEPAHFGPFNLPKRIKRLTMIHDLTPLLFPEYHRWHSQLLQRIFLKRILRLTDWVFTNSQHTSKDLVNFFPFCEHKNTAIYLGKSTIFKPTPNSAVLTNYGIAEPYFINVGTIEPRKQGLTLLAAFKHFCLKADKPVQLVLVGQKGWKTEAFDAALAEHPFKDRIIQTGHVATAHLPVLYTHSRALIYPSEYEGFGLPIVEALACGTAVIAADNSSLREIGEGSALFFPTGDTLALSEKMQEIYETKIDSSEKYIAQAAKFDWEHTARKFWEECEKVVQGSV
ncbi:MAG: glycosyltransferase family 1 protein [Bacteroidota bacterium]